MALLWYRGLIQRSCNKTLQPLHHSLEKTSLYPHWQQTFVYSSLKSYVAVSFPQALVLLPSSLPLVDTKPLFVMLLELQSYLLTLRAAMLPRVTTQPAKFAAPFNALRIPWFCLHLSKPYCQELLNVLSLAELLGLLSRRSVQTYGALVPILLKAHALPRSWQTLKM